MVKLFGPSSMGAMEEQPRIGYILLFTLTIMIETESMDLARDSYYNLVREELSSQTLTLYPHPLIVLYSLLLLQVKLEYPHEVLICISGYYGSIGGDEGSRVIKSLTFYTSRGKYGPFGEEIGTFFTSTTTEGKVVGLHGRSSYYLNAIGVHMQHWLGSQKPVKSSLFRRFANFS